jgi:hypothetical protein
MTNLVVCKGPRERANLEEAESSQSGLRICPQEEVQEETESQAAARRLFPPEKEEDMFFAESVMETETSTESVPSQQTTKPLLQTKLTRRNARVSPPPPATTPPLVDEGTTPTINESFVPDSQPEEECEIHASSKEQQASQPAATPTYNTTQRDSEATNENNQVLADVEQQTSQPAATQTTTTHMDLEVTNENNQVLAASPSSPQSATPMDLDATNENNQVLSDVEQQTSHPPTPTTATSHMDNMDAINYENNQVLAEPLAKKRKFVAGNTTGRSIIRVPFVQNKMTVTTLRNENNSLRRQLDFAEQRIAHLEQNNTILLQQVVTLSSSTATTPEKKPAPAYKPKNIIKHTLRGWQAEFTQLVVNDKKSDYNASDSDTEFAAVELLGAIRAIGGGSSSSSSSSSSTSSSSSSSGDVCSGSEEGASSSDSTNDRTTTAVDYFYKLFSDCHSDNPVKMKAMLKELRRLWKIKLRKTM